MAKNSSKATVAAQSPTAPEVPTPTQEAAGAPNLGKAVDDVLAEISKVQAKRAELTGLLAAVEKQKAKLREAEASYEAAAGAVDQLQAELIAKYPAAAGVFGDVKVSKRGGSRKASKAGRAKKGGNTLNLEQANQVLAAMPAQFELGAYSSKARELFPELGSAGAMKLVADKVKQVGGKGMGRRYKKV